MTKILLIITTTLLTILTIIFVMTFINRLTLPYNSGGNYIDEKGSVIYYQQSVIAYGLLTLILLMATIISTYFMLKNKKTKVTLK